METSEACPSGALVKRGAPYRVYALDAGGNRTPIQAYGIVIELRSGIEMEVDLAPHPNFSGQLVLMTPATSNMKAEYDAGNLDDFAVSFGSSNVLHVLVERRQRKKRRTARKV